MNRLRFILSILLRRRYTLALFIVSSIAGALAGASTTGLLAVIHRLIGDDSLSIDQHAAGFLLLAAGHAIFSIISSVTNVKVLQEISLDLRLEYSQRLLSTPLRTIEKVGSSKILNTFTHAIGSIADYISRLPVLVQDLTLLTGICIYMTWLFPFIFLMLLVFMVLGFIFYTLPLSAYRRFEKKLWTVRNRHFRYFHDLLGGIKELLQNRAKKQAILFHYLYPTGKNLADLEIRSSLMKTGINRWGDFYAFLGLALILTFLPQWGMASHQELGNVIILLLFTLRPMNSCIGHIFSVQNLKITLDQWEEMAGHLEQATAAEDVADAALNITRSPSFSLKVQDVVYT
ncbi:MAG: hypothetical protein GKR87_01040 [Kiritimatiellae bacterium]|nr:hypothetical protein [Kiritimatiellia bacterium]